MRILDARVRCGGVELKIPDSFPPTASFPFQFFPDDSRPQAGHYYAESDGWALVWHWTGRPDCGYAGRVFPILLEDGTPRDLVGPFDVGTAFFNSQGLGPIMSASWPYFRRDGLEATWTRGWTFSGGYVLVDVVRQALAEFCPAWEVGEHPIYRSDYGPGLSDEQMAIVDHGTQRPLNAVIYRVQEVDCEN